MEVVRRTATAQVKRVRELVLDRLTRQQQAALREISEALATGIADHAKLIAMGWPPR
jgi:hypothetical protein